MINDDLNDFDLISFKKFGKNKALFDQIVVIYRLMCKEIFQIKNE
jgi:hypothetical protein